MSRYRKRLPQLGQSVFLTDRELENTVSLRCGMDVPGLAAFDLLRHATGCSALNAYFARYAALACSHGLGLVLESATSRANSDWGALLGYDAKALAQVWRRAIELLLEAAAALASPGELHLRQPYSTEFVIGAPRGRSGPALMRSGSVAAEELSTSLSG